MQVTEALAHGYSSALAKNYPKSTNMTEKLAILQYLDGIIFIIIIAWQ